MVKFFKTFKQENKYVKKWFSDVYLRMNVSLHSSLVWNIAFAILQLGLGFYHNSFWFYSMFAYYAMLGIIRFIILKHTTKYKPKEKEYIEIKKYIISGWLLLIINTALSIIVFFMVYFNKTFHHHMITTIAMAAYTVITFIFAIINFIKYRKYRSPIYSSAKIISLIAGTVSILTLETTMLTTFGTAETSQFSQIILSVTGAAIIAFAIIVAVTMIIIGNKKLKELKITTKH